MLRVEADLPMERRTDWESWNGIVNVDVQPGAQKRGVTSLVSWVLARSAPVEHPDVVANQQHFTLGCAWMFLFDVYAFSAENTLAVNVARRMTATIGLIGRLDAYDDLDVFIAMTWVSRFRIAFRCLSS